MFKSLLALLAVLCVVTLASTAQAYELELVAELTQNDRYAGFATYSETSIDDERILQILEVNCSGKAGQRFVVAIDGHGIAEVVADSDGKVRFGVKSVRTIDRDDGKIPAIKPGYTITAGQASGSFR